MVEEGRVSERAEVGSEEGQERGTAGGQPGGTRATDTSHPFHLPPTIGARHMPTLLYVIDFSNHPQQAARGRCCKLPRWTDSCGGERPRRAGPR